MNILDCLPTSLLCCHTLLVGARYAYSHTHHTVLDGGGNFTCKIIYKIILNFVKTNQRSITIEKVIILIFVILHLCGLLDLLMNILLCPPTTLSYCHTLLVGARYAVSRTHRTALDGGGNFSYKSPSTKSTH